MLSACYASAFIAADAHAAPRSLRATLVTLIDYYADFAATIDDTLLMAGWRQLIAYA